MAETQTVNGITFLVSTYNHCHTTTQELRCDICNKKVHSVHMIMSQDETMAIFYGIGCDKSAKCGNIASNRLSLAHPEDTYSWGCAITDIEYENRRSTKKRVRSEMTLKLRYKVLQRDNFCCILCGRRPPEVPIAVDHISPVSSGGKNELSNLTTLCRDCNLGKGAE